MARIAIVLNASWNIYNFRLPLLNHLAAKGHEIIAIAPEDEYTDKIPYEFHPVRISSSSTNPIRHLAVFASLLRLFRKLKPDIALLYTIQPNIYGNLAARFSGVQTISNIAGLGNLFIQERLATQMAKRLYRTALRLSGKVFFQNQDDRQLFIEKHLVTPELTERIPGSGVDLERFKPGDGIPAQNPFTFLMAGRMLREKGVAEFVTAAKFLLDERKDVKFRLLGPLGVDNPTALTIKDIEHLTTDDGIEYCGVSDSMEEEFAQADCFVLPTYYREGVPKSLIEAAAMGMPIITTRNPGCTDVVKDGVNGYLCEPRDARDLARAMRQVLQMPEVNRIEMGRQGRLKAEKVFDQKIVFAAYEQAISELLH